MYSGLLEDMNRRGIEYIHFYGVDNCLVRVGDPTFVGFAAERGAVAAAKVVAKAYPAEPVGVFALRNGRCEVVEYSEIDPTLAEVRLEGSTQTRCRSGLTTAGRGATNRAVTPSNFFLNFFYRREMRRAACYTTRATSRTTSSRWRS